MATTSWMVERLSSETRVHHAEVDGGVDLLFRPDATATHYLVFLMRIYGFEAPLESAVLATPGLELLLDLRTRGRSALLAKDLLALGLRDQDIAELPHCLQIPAFRGAAEALGWMYVTERLTLAHNVIRRHLLTRLPTEMERASAYLQSYAGVVGKRWAQYGAALDQVARHPTIADRIISAANEAFECQRRWIQLDQHDFARAGVA